MNIESTINEIGIIETNLNIENYSGNFEVLLNKIKNFPLKFNNNSKKIINNVVNYINDSKKEYVFLLGNEIALIENIVNRCKKIKKIFVVLSRNLLKEEVENIKNNNYDDNAVTFIYELDFPSVIIPANSLLFAFGYKYKSKCLLFKNSYRMVKIYKEFLGRKIFVNCLFDDKIICNNLISVNLYDFFTEEVGGIYEE